MPKQCNLDIRDRAKAEGIYLWEIAEKLGVNDVTFSKWLRKELPCEIKTEINTIIDNLKDAQQKVSKRAC